MGCGIVALCLISPFPKQWLDLSVVVWVCYTVYYRRKLRRATINHSTAFLLLFLVTRFACICDMWNCIICTAAACEQNHPVWGQPWALPRVNSFSSSRKGFSCCHYIPLRSQSWYKKINLWLCGWLKSILCLQWGFTRTFFVGLVQLQWGCCLPHHPSLVLGEV